MSEVYIKAVICDICTPEYHSEMGEGVTKGTGKCHVCSTDMCAKHSKYLSFCFDPEPLKGGRGAGVIKIGMMICDNCTNSHIFSFDESAWKETLVGIIKNGGGVSSGKAEKEEEMWPKKPLLRIYGAGSKVKY